ncbi:MAG: M14 family metallocarboxypeptidase [Verrucomicrobiales bacterium]
MTTNPVTAYGDVFARLAEGQNFKSEVIWESGADSILIWTRSSSPAFAPRVYISAGIHGDEPCGPDALLRFLELHQLSCDCDWVIAPVLNPSGLRQGTRENAEGIDLNRDFFRRETGEVCALIDWWVSQDRGCDLHLSLHEDWETSGLYLYEINTGGVGSLAEKILASIQKIVPLESSGPVDGHELSAPGLILHDPEPDEEFGWPEAIWLARKFRVLSITFEAPGRIPKGYRTAGLVTALGAAVDEIETLAVDPERWLWSGAME